MSAPAELAVILAGGQGRRLGGGKAGALLAGRPLIEHAIATVRAAGLEPVVCVRPGTVLPPLGDVAVWQEPATGEASHPLAGLAYAVGRAGRPVLALPTDLPFLPPALLAALAQRPEPLAVVADAGRPAALVLRAAPSHAEPLAQAAQAGAPVMGTLRTLGAALLDLRTLDPTADARALFNVNDAADLARAEQRLGATAG